VAARGALCAHAARACAGPTGRMRLDGRLVPGDDSPRRLGERLRARDLTAAPAVLNLVENRAPERREAVAALLASVSPATPGGEAPAHVVGITGPPGAGKSSLLALLVPAWRTLGRSVEIG